jgi:hypothetical protein
LEGADWACTAQAERTPQAKARVESTRSGFMGVRVKLKLNGDIKINCDETMNGEGNLLGHRDPVKLLSLVCAAAAPRSAGDFIVPFPFAHFECICGI